MGKTESPEKFKNFIKTSLFVKNINEKLEMLLDPSLNRIKVFFVFGSQGGHQRWHRLVVQTNNSTFLSFEEP